ncbi:hypothetical protein NDU88_010330 [Pleurodeles waltl]|uniref:Uncharacterized protein n=1 Tax=Pleurodeles waltl TaxID=8319 RepID=A0AAV7QZY9_PLEWA|nr:hypothetical protein NDU88_010330 [Pleurodeles waltl]
MPETLGYVPWVPETPSCLHGVPESLGSVHEVPEVWSLGITDTELWSLGTRGLELWCLGTEGTEPFTGYQRLRAVFTSGYQAYSPEVTEAEGREPWVLVPEAHRRLAGI